MIQREECFFTGLINAGVLLVPLILLLAVILCGLSGDWTLFVVVAVILIIWVARVVRSIRGVR